MMAKYYYEKEGLSFGPKQQYTIWGPNIGGRKLMATTSDSLCASDIVSALNGTDQASHDAMLGALENARNDLVNEAGIVGDLAIVQVREDLRVAIAIAKKEG